MKTPKNVKLGVYFIIICYISCQLLVPQTHNLEVPGSSPGWSTLKIRELRIFRDSLFLFGEIQVKFVTKKL